MCVTHSSYFLNPIIWENLRNSQDSDSWPLKLNRFSIKRVKFIFFDKKRKFDNKMFFNDFFCLLYYKIINSFKQEVSQNNQSIYFSQNFQKFFSWKFFLNFSSFRISNEWMNESKSQSFVDIFMKNIFPIKYLHVNEFSTVFGSVDNSKTRFYPIKTWFFEWDFFVINTGFWHKPKSKLSQIILENSFSFENKKLYCFLSLTYFPILQKVFFFNLLLPTKNASELNWTESNCTILLYKHTGRF